MNRVKLVARYNSFQWINLLNSLFVVVLINSSAYFFKIIVYQRRGRRRRATVVELYRDASYSHSNEFEIMNVVHVYVVYSKGDACRPIHNASTNSESIEIRQRTQENRTCFYGTISIFSILHRAEPRRATKLWIALYTIDRFVCHWPKPDNKKCGNSSRRPLIPFIISKPANFPTLVQHLHRFYTSPEHIVYINCALYETYLTPAIKMWTPPHQQRPYSFSHSLTWLFY